MSVLNLMHPINTRAREASKCECSKGLAQGMGYYESWVVRTPSCRFLILALNFKKFHHNVLSFLCHNGAERFAEPHHTES